MPASTSSWSSSPRRPCSRTSRRRPAGSRPATCRACRSRSRSYPRRGSLPGRGRWSRSPASWKLRGRRSCRPRAMSSSAGRGCSASSPRANGWCGATRPRRRSSPGPTWSVSVTTTSRRARRLPGSPHSCTPAPTCWSPRVAMAACWSMSARTVARPASCATARPPRTGKPIRPAPATRSWPPCSRRCCGRRSSGAPGRAGRPDLRFAAAAGSLAVEGPGLSAVPDRAAVVVRRARERIRRAVVPSEETQVGAVEPTEG